MSSYFCVTELLQSLYNVYLIWTWNHFTLRGKEADGWRNEPQLCVIFGHLSDSLTSVRGGLRQQSEFLVTHHSLADGFTFNWGLMRSVLKQRRSTQQRLGCTCPLRPHRGPLLWFSHPHESLSYLNLFSSSVCRQWMRHSRWRRFSICVRFLVMSFCSQAETSHVGMFTAAILFDMYVLCCCFVIHFLTSLGLHLCLCHSSSHSHLSPVYISQIQTQKFKARQAWWQQPWQPVGLTFWEAAANLSLLNVYLLTSTLHELRPQERGRCCFMWVAGTLQHLQFITNTVQPKKVPQECNLLVQNKREICATVQNFALSNT